VFIQDEWVRADASDLIRSLAAGELWGGNLVRIREPLMMKNHSRQSASKGWPRRRIAMPHTVGRLARFAGVLTLMVVSTTPRPLAEGVGTLAYIVHGECPGEGATSGYWPHCPLGLALMHPDGSGQLQLTGDGADAEPAWSPGGLRTMEALGSQLFVINGDDTGFTQLTFPPGHHAFPLRFLSSRAKRSAK
jgi:hypothetical protein